MNQPNLFINLLLVDIDGTLTGTKSGKPFKQSPDDILPLQGAQKAIAYFANRGYKIYGISNQGGCDTINPNTGKPYKSVDDAVAEMHNTLKLFPEIVEGIYFCPSMTGENCIFVCKSAIVDMPLVISNIKNDFWQGLYRKPDIGMVNEIEYLYDGIGVVNKQESLFVGDRDEDRQCAANAGIPFMDAATWRFKYGSFV